MGDRGWAQRLSEAERAELEARRGRLRQELRLLEGELRADEMLRLQAEAKARVAAEPGRLRGRWREWVG
jgi:hypothetical protein